MARLGVLASIALRNLFTSWLNLIIGLLMLAGTVLVVLGGAVRDSLDRSMSSSIVGSVAGHAQVYSAASKGKLEVFGSFGGDDSDLTPISDFSQMDKVLRQVPDVKEVVPMGIKGAMLTSGNTIDLILTRLRDAVRAQEAGDTSQARKDQIESLKLHVRHIVQILQGDLTLLQAYLSEKGTEERDAASIRAASSDAFWAGFDKDPLGNLEFLENRIAPLLADGDLIYIRYIGTDPDKFQRTFDRMRIIQGTPIPTGHRGFLFARGAYEDNFKLKVAWRLDRIKEAIDTNNKKIAEDDEIKRWVKENKSQTREIALQLDPQRTQTAVARLQKALGSQEAGLEPLLKQLLDVNDDNFQERYRVFYDDLAKDLLELYRVRVGDTLTISAYTHAGYVQSVNVKVYGVFQFDGLEKSPLGGFTNLMDLVTFRDLYGYLTEERAAELKKLKAASGAKDISRDQAEAELFGDARQLSGQATEATIDEDQLLRRDPAEKRSAASNVDRTFSPEELNHGVVLNAAVLFNDPTNLEAKMEALTQTAKKAGFDWKVVSWQEAAGLIGQFVRLGRLALFIFVFIIFVVTLIIINNAMMMATLQRIREIGTLRAIGAQRGFVLALVCVETLMLGLVFGAAGLVAGSGAVAILHYVGIGASTPELYFFFSGPRLYPTLGVGNLVLAFAIVMVVSLISTLYPALIATRVSPLRAMQTEE